MRGTTRGPTRRHLITLREYRRGYVTQAQLASEWGITRSAVSKRYRRGLKATGQAPPPRALPRIRLRPLSLSDLSV